MPEDWLETGRLAELGLHSAELIHEMRQPVFAVKALAQILASEEGADQRLTTMLAQIDVMQQLVERYARLSQRPGSELAKVSLPNMAEAALSLLQRSGERRGVDIRLQVVADVAVLAEPVAVQQVVTNLVLNGIHDGQSWVEVTIDGCAIRVADDGGGVPDEVREHLFEPFVTTKPPGEGTGLGLAVAHRLMEQQGGQLQLLPGSPTTFEATFQEHHG